MAYKINPSKPITPDDIVADPIIPARTAPVRIGPFNPVKMSTRYDYAKIENPAVDFDPSDPKSRSLTNQSDKDSTDINLIMARYEKSGMITDLITGDQRKPMYGDFTVIGDYFAIQNTVARVSQAFDVLPASTKNRFKNDPKLLVDFFADAANDVEAVKLGLKDKSVLPPGEVFPADAPPAPAVPAPGQPA